MEWNNVRVLVVGSYDSFLRAALAHGRQLERLGATIEVAVAGARRKQLSVAQLKTLGLPPETIPLPIERIATADYLQKYQVILLALDGGRTRGFMIHFLKNKWEKTRPLTVSLYPGIIFRFALEGMVSRISCDAVLLNSRSDFRLYQSLLRELGIADNNGLPVGLSIVPPRQDARTDMENRREIVFIGQPTVPAARHERMYVVHQMVTLAQKYPAYHFSIKPRHRIGERTLHREKYHFEVLLREYLKNAPPPTNLSVTYDSMEAVLNRSRLCLTVSSTAALEAAFQKIPTRVITDFGIHENLGNHFFIGSGLLGGFESVTPDMAETLQTDWVDENILSAGEHPDVLSSYLRNLLEAQDAQQAPLPLRNTRIFGQSSAYSTWVSSTFGWKKVAQIGDSRPPWTSPLHFLRQLFSRIGK